TFQCVPRFNILGRQDTTDVEACAIDLFGDGREHRPGLQTFLETTEYARLLWWPQAGVERIVVWQARRMLDSDYNSCDCCSGRHRNTGTPERFHARPFREFPDLFGSYLPAESAAFVFASLVGKFPDWLEKCLGRIRFRVLKFIIFRVLKF